MASNDGSLELLLKNGEKSREDMLPSESSSPPFRGMGSLCVHSLLLLIASIFFILWITSVQALCPLDPLLSYSPANEAVTFVEKRFDGSLNSTSIFRGPPGPAIDAAWSSVSTDVKATRLTREQFLMVGGNESNTAVIKYQPQDGGGYMSQIDCYHHVHCLDMLRKYLRRDYYAPFDVSFNSVLRPHLAHCIEILRQKLMCTSDLTMVTYDWAPDMARLRPNMSTVHQCVDYQRILDWSAEHNAHVLASHVVKFGDGTELLEHPM